MLHGVIKKLVKEKGFGFITIEGRSKDLFFHMSGMANGQDFKSLKEGDSVSVEEIVNNGRGESASGVSVEE